MECITLDWFGSDNAGYHIGLLLDSRMDEQAHYHDYFQVCYVVSGELVHRQEGESLILGAGDAFIIPPGFIHSLHFNNPTTKMYSLAFSSRLFQSGILQSVAMGFLKNIQTNESVLLRVVMDRKQRRLVEELMEGIVMQQETDVHQELSAVPSLVLAIVCLFAQCYYGQSQNAEKLEKTAPWGNDILRCVEYIDSHYREPMLLKDLAKKFGISQSAFCAVFPQFTGTTLKKYIAGKRIEEAQILIRLHPEWSISRVCAEVGYEDDSTFYRNFLRITGVAPAAYRKMHTDH